MQYPFGKNLPMFQYALAVHSSLHSAICSSRTEFQCQIVQQLYFFARPLQFCCMIQISFLTAIGCLDIPSRFLEFLIMNFSVFLFYVHKKSLYRLYIVFPFLKPVAQPVNHVIIFSGCCSSTTHNRHRRL